MEVQTTYGYRPIHSASERGRLFVCELLIQSGCLLDTQDESGQTGTLASLSLLSIDVR
jgi:ankyrin repeat protein